jgi:DEAD/DEAH box helicase domain-containing protein
VSENKPVVVFDLETQNSFDEVGGYRNTRALKMSVGVTWNSADQAFHRYAEQDVPALIQELKSAALVVGFNVLNFDYEVLAAYTGEPLRGLPTVDMLDHIYRKLGFRVKLDDLVRASLNVQKSGDGLDAIRWWRAGQLDRLFDYCQQDVAVTRRLYEFGKQNKYVMFYDKRYKLQRVAVNW